MAEKPPRDMSQAKASISIPSMGIHELPLVDDMDAPTGTADDFLPGTADDWRRPFANVETNQQWIHEQLQAEIIKLTQVPAVLIEQGPLLTAAEMAQRLSQSFTITIQATNEMRAAFDKVADRYFLASSERRKAKRFFRKDRGPRHSAGYRRHVRKTKARRRRP